MKNIYAFSFLIVYICLMSLSVVSVARADTTTQISTLYSQALKETQRTSTNSIQNAEKAYKETLLPVKAVYDKSVAEAVVLRDKRIQEAQAFYAREVEAANKLENANMKKSALQAAQKKLSAGKTESEKMYREAVKTAKSGMDARLAEPQSSLARGRANANEGLKTKKEQLSRAYNAYKTAVSSADKAQRDALKVPTSERTSATREVEAEKNKTIADALAVLKEAKKEALADFAEERLRLKDSPTELKTAEAEKNKLIADAQKAYDQARNDALRKAKEDKSVIESAYISAKASAVSAFTEAKSKAEVEFRRATGL